MKHSKIFSVFALVFLLINTYSQIDTWEPIVENGFGFSTQNTVPEMEVFNDTLYVATAPLTSPGLAKLWRSGTGEAPWEEVSPPLNADNSIHSFGKTELGGGYFWVGTGSGSKGAMIFQSRNGKDWTPISKRGFGNTALIAAAPNMVVFNNYLYAGVGSHGGGESGEVWRIPYTSIDSTEWVKLIDFDTVQTTINDTVDLISYFEVWNNKIYFGTNAKGQLWESSDGVNFTQNTGVGYGFAPEYLTNVVISAIEIFNNAMYLTTTNYSGGQLWRSADGLSFTNITDDAFGEGQAVSELRKPIIANGRLWITAYTETDKSTGTPIWRSDDGLVWQQSNTNGFGNTQNNGQNACLVGFKGYTYFGGPNYTVGGQVWRTNLPSGISENTLVTNDVKIYPNPVFEKDYFTIDFNGLEIKTIEISNIAGQRLKTISCKGKNRVNISLDNLNSAVYFIKLELEDEKLITEKIIIN